MQIAQSKTRDSFPLSRKKIVKKSLVTWICISFLFVVAFLPTLAVGVANSAGSVIFFLLLELGIYFGLLALVYYYQLWYWSVYYYDLNSDYIVIRKGPITPREITIPYERVQDVYVDQDVLDRLFGIYDVHLSSATISSGMQAHIDGVEKPAADGLRELLLKTVKEKISKK